MSLRVCSFLPLLVLLLCGCTEVREEFYPDGTLRSRIAYRGGKENGLAIFYEPNGAKSSEVQMKEGKKEGRFRTFYYGGNVQSEATYQNDSLTGTYYVYDKDGALMEETNFKHGKKNGQYRAWHARDLIQTIGAFKDDLWHGTWEFYDGRGFLVGEGSFEEGTGTIVNYNSQGLKHKVTQYVRNQKDGDEIYFNASGDEEKRLTFSKDRIIAVNGIPIQRDSL